MSYIFAHEGYKSHLWGDNMPDIVRQLPDTIRRLVCIEHNKSVGSAWAAMYKDIQIVVQVNDEMVKKEESLRNAKDVWEAKYRRQSETVRRLVEELKVCKEQNLTGRA